MDFVVGPVVEAVVCKLLDEVLDALKDLKNRDGNLQKLERLLQRLQPFVQELQDFAQDNGVDPARQWLEHLQEELETAHDVIQDCSKAKMGIFLRLRSSRKLLTMYETIMRLLSEASIAQWAAGLSSNRSLKEDLELARNDRAEVKTKVDKLEQRIIEISEALTFEPPRLPTREIQHLVSEPIDAVHTQDYGSSSSAATAWTSSSSTLHEEKQRWNRASDIAEPTVSFGGDAVAQKLISSLISPGRYRKWRGLWAGGGAGKTFAARKIYNDERVRKHFTGGMYWVTVSKDQPPIYMLLKHLFEYIGCKGEFPESLEEGKALLKSRLDRDKVLLILDDVWEPRTLGHLDLISDVKKGVILVTTRDDNNLKGVMDSDDIIQVPRLSEDDSWKLFSWHAFLAHQKNVPADLEDVARAVADECKGLPLALQVIGSTMANVRLLDWEVQQLGKDLRQEWEDALEKLRRANVGKGEYETLYRRLQLSVDNLSEEDPRLRDCFCYFAAFPEDYEVDINLLVNIWIAEGIVGNEQQSLAYRKREGRALVGLLVSKSMIELSSSYEQKYYLELNPYRRLHRCKMHDVMRDLAHRNLKWKVGRRQNLVEIPPTKRTCLYAPGLKSLMFPEEWTIPGTQCSAERLSFHSSHLQQLPDQFNARSLRVLILSVNWDLRALSPRFFGSLSQLTVLDLSYTCINKLSGTILLSLTSLTFLNLESCRYLQKISDRIGDLQNLQSIFLHGCGSLQKLPRLKSLTKLHTLLLPLRNYTWTDAILRRPEKDFRQVVQLHNLRKLCIYLHSSSFVPDLSPLTTLEELDVQCAMSLPVGMSELRNLKTLHIAIELSRPIGVSGITELEFQKTGLQTLPLLQELEVNAWISRDSGVKGGPYHCVALPKSFGHSGAFPSLRRMIIKGWDPDNAAVFTFHQGAMPKIQRLTLSLTRASAGQEQTSSRASLEQKMQTSLGALGRSLNYLELLGYVESLETVFREPSEFPNLEYLDLGWVGVGRRLPSTIAALPRLRWLRYNAKRENWPQNLMQLEKEGILKIESRQ